MDDLENELENELERIKSLARDFEGLDSSCWSYPLHHIHKHSQWYSARYIAGKALKIPHGDLSEKLTWWIECISNEIPSWKNIICFGLYDDFQNRMRWWNYNPIGAIATAGENLRRAEKDLRKLYVCVDDGPEIRKKISLLLKIPEPQFLSDELIRGTELYKHELFSLYHSNDVDSSVKIRAGICLGYSRLRSIIHAIPKTRVFLGASLAGISYFIYQYFSR